MNEWNDQGIEGAWRFLRKLWTRAYTDLDIIREAQGSQCDISAMGQAERSLYRKLHETVKTITDEMCYAAADALAGQIGDKLDEDHILPNMDDWEIFPREAAAVGMKAQEQGIARLEKSYDELLEHAMSIIKRSRDMTQMMMSEGYIPEPPKEEVGLN